MANFEIPLLLAEIHFVGFRNSLRTFNFYISSFTSMSPDKFRKAYFEQYAEEDDICDASWFESYFENSVDWFDVVFRAEDELTIYGDPESEIGGFWAATPDGSVEGPFPTLEALANTLDYSIDEINAGLEQESDDDDFGDDDEDSDEEMDPIDLDDEDFDDEDYDEDFSFDDDGR